MSKSVQSAKNQNPNNPRSKSNQPYYQGYQRESKRTVAALDFFLSHAPPHRITAQVTDTLQRCMGEERHQCATVHPPLQRAPGSSADSQRSKGSAPVVLSNAVGDPPRGCLPPDSRRVVEASPCHLPSLQSAGRASSLRGARVEMRDGNGTRRASYPYKQTLHA